MGGIDHHHVDPRLAQRLEAVHAIGAGANGGANPQSAPFVFTGVGVGDRLLHIFHGDESGQLACLVDHDQFFDAVLMQQPLGLLQWSALIDGDEVGGHQ